MRVYYSPDHKLRDAKTELYGGELIAPFEAPFRAEMILEAVRTQGHTDILPPDDYGLETAKKVHAADYLEFLETAWDRWIADGYRGEAIPTCFPARRMQVNRPPADIDGALGYYAFAAETSITQGTWAAALAAKNCALSGANHIASGASSAFALCRPPGHHASKDQFGGYSFLNNCAIAAQKFLDEGAQKVAIVDVDFHHGNGTQDIFYDRADIFFASIHGEPVLAFPHFLGFADETGIGPGKGLTANYPLPRNTDFATWSKVLTEALERVAAFQADALVVSLGVDTFENDPISFFKLSSNDFLSVGDLIAGANLPTLFCMGGGYGVDEIGLNTANVLTGFEQAKSRN
ncbi:MAG: histone deacetylase family protein [Pseudomonadota bacterium]